LQPPGAGAHPMIRLRAPLRGVGVATADRLANTAVSRPVRDPRAVARYGGLTGSPDASSRRRRQKGVARAGNPRVGRGMIQLAWRVRMLQKDSALARWSWRRTTAARAAARKTMLVALAGKRLVAPCSGPGARLWRRVTRLVTTGAIPEGVVLRPSSSRAQQPTERPDTAPRRHRATRAPNDPRWR
jgi:transposase